MRIISDDSKSFIAALILGLIGVFYYGFIRKDLTINEKNIKDKYVILNGESLLKERLDTGFVKIKAHIKEFENWEDMKKRALSFDIRETYTKEELNIKIRAIIREKIRLNEKFTSQEKT